LGEAGSSISDTAANFPKYGCAEFQFCPKFPQNGGFLASNIVFLEENFPTGRKFCNRLKLRGDCLPPASMPMLVAD